MASLAADTPRAPPLRHSSGAIGLLLAILALVSQLALGAMLLPDRIAETKAAELDALAILCRAGAPPHHNQTPPPRHAPNTALCPLAVTLALPAIILAAAIVPPRRSVTTMRQDWPPASARGPPPLTARAHYPRGPPVLA